jgi:hypothetical protein
MQPLAKHLEGGSLGDLTNLAEQKSDSDIPAFGARAFKVRCSASGTCRSWIIFDMF